MGSDAGVAGLVVLLGSSAETDSAGEGGLEIEFRVGIVATRVAVRGSESESESPGAKSGRGCEVDDLDDFFDLCFSFDDECLCLDFLDVGTFDLEVVEAEEV